MKRPLPVFHALAVALLVAGCSSYRPAPAAFHEILDQPYRLGAGDRVRVTVFEQEGLTLQQEVATAYEEIAIIASDRVTVVDATGTVEEVHRRVMEAVNARAGAA